MNITHVHLVLVGSAALLAVLWMGTFLVYAVLICIILICSWLFGLLMCLQSSRVAAVVDGLPSVSYDKHSLLHSTVVRLSFLLLLIL